MNHITETQESPKDEKLTGKGFEFERVVDGGVDSEFGYVGQKPAGVFSAVGVGFLLFHLLRSPDSNG